MTKRVGFTLLELIVCCAILAILFGLVLTAVSKARLSGDRAVDGNRMRQLGLAITDLAATQNHWLPAATTFIPSEYRDETLFEQLLVYYGVPDRYLYYQNNSIRVPTVMLFREFVSPLDPTVKLTDRDYCYSSYALNYQVFGRKPRRMESITDGASNTIFCSQHHSICGIGAFNYREWLSYPWVFGADASTVEARSTFAEHHNHARARIDFYPISAGEPPVSDSAGSVTFQCHPRIEECDPRRPNTGDPYALPALMGDGRVIRIHKSIKSTLFWAAVTPAADDMTELE